jgi:DNA repair protein RecO (recombination protein O)
MPAIKDEAITLRRLDYSETSQVLMFLTREHGSRKLIAKGIKRGTKKQFATGIDLLERGQVMLIAKSQSDASLGVLTEWRQLDAYLGLRGDLRRLYGGQYAAEITAAMVEEADPDAELYDALRGLLEGLARDQLAGVGQGLASQPKPLPLLVSYQCALLRSAGVWPDLSRCIICGKAAPPGRAGYLAPHEGGLACRDCEPGLIEKRKVSGLTLDALRTAQFTTETAREAFDLLNYTITHIIGRPPTLARYVLQT